MRLVVVREGGGGGGGDIGGVGIRVWSVEREKGVIMVFC